VKSTEDVDLAAAVLGLLTKSRVSPATHVLTADTAGKRATVPGEVRRTRPALLRSISRYLGAQATPHKEGMNREIRLWQFDSIAGFYNSECVEFFSVRLADLVIKIVRLV
jgi:hypothetical protein